MTEVDLHRLQLEQRVSLLEEKVQHLQDLAKLFKDLLLEIREAVKK